MNSGKQPEQPIYIDALLDRINRDIMQQFMQTEHFEPFSFIFGPYRVSVELRNDTRSAAAELEEA